MTEYKVDITSSIDIARPAADVWAVLSDFARNPEWQRGMRSCEWTTDPPIAVGSRYVQEARFLGRTIHTTFEVVELDEGRHTVTIDTVEGTFPIAVTRTVESRGEGSSRAVAHVRGSPTGLMGLLSPLMKPTVRRSVADDYARLKRLLEA